MGAGNSVPQTVLFYKLKINKDTDVPYFYRKEKKNDAWVETDTYSEMSGYITGIEIKEYTWDNQKKESIVISMKDNESDDKIIITTSFNNMTRSLLNSLAGCDTIGLVKMKAALWGKKGAEKKYPTIFLDNNNQKTEWRYPINEIPAIEKITNKKGEVVSFDDSDCNAFFKQVINTEIIPKLTSPKEVKNEMEQPKMSEVYINENPKQESWGVPDAVDDLPFAIVSILTLSLFCKMILLSASASVLMS